jgi:hypothetical protein
MDNIVAAVAIITGLTEVIKRLGVPTKYIPLVAIVLGVLYAGFVLSWESQAIIGGIVAGLTSVGLYRSVQKIAK